MAVFKALLLKDTALFTLSKVPINSETIKINFSTVSERSLIFSVTSFTLSMYERTPLIDS